VALIEPPLIEISDPEFFFERVFPAWIVRPGKGDGCFLKVSQGHE
jgi:hypothetical protein